MYIWEEAAWPDFSFSQKKVDRALNKALQAHSRLFEYAQNIDGQEQKQLQLDALIQNAIKTSAIEGESLNVESVRSSMARQLGLEKAALNKKQQKEEALVSMLLSALDDLKKPLTKNMLCQWQAKLFVEPSLLRKIDIGKLRKDKQGPMQVVSQRSKKTIVHFEAPPAKQLPSELKQFLNFYNQNAQQHVFIHCAIAHLYFLSLHPFDDGNGRVARALSDRLLAKFENSSARFYSLSSAIEANRKMYYQYLELTQSCESQSQKNDPLDITTWIIWFIEILTQAIESGVVGVERILLKAKFWKQHAQTVLQERQIKVLNRLLDSYGLEFQEGIAARHYQSIAKVSKATATRDLSDLLEKGCLQSVGGGGRSVRYYLKPDASVI